MVLPASHGVSRVPRYSGTYHGSLCLFAYEAITPSCVPFHAASAKTQVSNFRGALPDTRDRSYNPRWTTAAACHVTTVWAFPRSLATTWGISVDFFSSGYLDVSVHRVRLPTLCIQVGIPLARWVSPFGYRGIKASLPAPPRFSQACTSFIACDRQGIHHMHLVA